MKGSYKEDLANHFGLQRRGVLGNRSVFIVRAKGNAGQLLNSEITTSVCRSCPDKQKATLQQPSWRGSCGHGKVCDPVHAWTSQLREPGGPAGSHLHAAAKCNGIGGAVRQSLRWKVRHER